jgi:hypothetical protein
MKRLAAVFAVVSLALTGCGSSLCNDLADETDALGQKIKPCNPDIPTDPVTEEEINQCKDELKRCTDADKEVLETFTECISKLPTCSTSNQNTFATGLATCGAELTKVSDACLVVSSSETARQIARFNVSR